MAHFGTNYTRILNTYFIVINFKNAKRLGELQKCCYEEMGKITVTIFTSKIALLMT